MYYNDSVSALLVQWSAVLTTIIADAFLRLRWKRALLRLSLPYQVDLDTNWVGWEFDVS